jgi:4-amino-4-deoxy-L-arabinose transferase-like glycosyltransferase
MWKPLWQRLHLPSGILLMLLIAAPWYLLAERTSPGFLEYFIVGEHFQRFVDSGWKGDLYGSGHKQTRGMIWVFWFAFALPWSPLLLFAAGTSVIRRSSLIPADRLLLFMLLWMCSPMLLFTVAGNILPAYVLPGLPALGILIVKTMPAEPPRYGRLLLLVGPVLLLLLCLLAALVAANEYSDKGLLAAGIDSGDELYYFVERPYSAQYYSNGRARITDTFPASERFYLVIEKNRSLEQIADHCELRAQNHDRRLYFCRRGPPA